MIFISNDKTYEILEPGKESLFVQVFGQILGNPFENTLPDPLLEPPVACLVRWILLGKIFSGGTRTQYP
jgi:hypothetical protein